MYVCSCQAVTRYAVEDAIASGAQSIDEIASHCGAGSECRGCWPTLFELLDTAVTIRPRRLAEAS